jgi:hypothetical protein
MKIRKMIIPLNAKARRFALPGDEKLRAFEENSTSTIVAYRWAMSIV